MAKTSFHSALKMRNRWNTSLKQSRLICLVLHRSTTYHRGLWWTIKRTISVMIERWDAFVKFTDLVIISFGTWETCWLLFTCLLLFFLLDCGKKGCYSHWGFYKSPSDLSLLLLVMFSIDQLQLVPNIAIIVFLVLFANICCQFL